MPLPERKLIERIARRAKSPGGISALRAGIGDDCAVLRPPSGQDLLVTTDFTLEDVHFRRDWHPPAVVGHRCLARGLSDIAAMGGEPIAAFLSLALPAGLPQAWVDAFISGLLRLARRFRVPLAGGDLAQSPSQQPATQGGILADIMVLGVVPTGKAVLRSGARPGDAIYVTGALGGAAGTIAHFYRGTKAKNTGKHLLPTPRIAVGRVLRQRGVASAMIDLSDGLSTDLDHICECSGTGAELQADSIPRAKFGRREVDLDMALHGGEDYELLFTARADARVPSRIAGVPIHQIGQITRGRRIDLVEDGKKAPLRPSGWEHFRHKS